jgi:hypothetical protein
MYRDPLNEPTLTEEEWKLQPDYDPSVDYWAKIQAIHPAWIPPTVEWRHEATDAAISPEHSTRDVVTREKDAKGRMRSVRRVMGHVRYVRAIDVAGNLGPLSISTIRPDKKHQHGFDGILTEQILLAKKMRRGWIVVEKGFEDYWVGPFAQGDSNRYAAWALAVMRERKKLHAEYEKVEGEIWLDEKRKEAKARAEEQAALTGTAIADALAKAMPQMAEAAVAKATKAKSKEQP